MEFFDKLSQKASEAYKITADKTGKIAKETKLKLKISEIKSQITSLYEEIGKLAYNKHSRRKQDKEKCENNCKEIKKKCEKIDDLNDEIDDLVKQCLDLNDKKQCDNCHEEIEKNVKYCPNCGTKQEEKEALEPEVIEKVEDPKEGNAFGEEQKIEEIEEDAEASTEEEKTNLEKTVEVESNPQIESEDSKKEEE